MQEEEKEGNGNPFLAEEEINQEAPSSDSTVTQTNGEALTLTPPSPPAGNEDNGNSTEPSPHQFAENLLQNILKSSELCLVIIMLN